MTALAKGIIIGVIAVVVLVALMMGVLIVAGVYGWKSAQRAGNEAATVQNLKTIAALEIQYFNTHNRNFGTFDEMVKEGMLTSRFKGDVAIVDGYIFTLKVSAKTASRPASYTLNADPQSDATGKNHFYIDSILGTIHVKADQPASATDALFVD